jgi:uncharacterized protein (TIGR00369 family)
MPPFPAKTPDDLAGRDTMLSMSGLAFLEAMLAGKVASPPIARTMNLQLHEVGPGRAVFRGTPGFEHANPMGAVHGGWYGTILDSALGCAAMSVVPQGFWYTTLEYKVNICRALPIGAEALAVAEVSHAGRSTVVAEARLLGPDGRVYATGSTTCIILPG